MNFEIKIDFDDPKPIYLQIIDSIKTGIVMRKLKPQDKIISVRKLAQEINVNRNTVSKAYMILENEGLLYSKKGLGTYVSEKPPEIDKNDLLDLMEKRMDKILIDAYQLRIPLKKIKSMLNDRISDFITSR